MKREEVIDTLRIYFEQQVYGRGLIPVRGATVKNSNIGWEEFKFQFGDEKLQILKNRVLEFYYGDIIGVTYESQEDVATIIMYFKKDIPLIFKTPIKTKWCNFSSKSSIMKYRWGDLEVGRFLFCKGEAAHAESPLVVFTRQPFDFDLDGNMIVLDDGERWLGYLIEGENASFERNEPSKPRITRRLDIEGFQKKIAIVKETIDYYFENGSNNWYRSTSYFSVDSTKY